MPAGTHFTLSRAPSPQAQRAFSLVELMIALAIGLGLLLVISYAYLGSKQTFRLQDTLSRMQENARFVFETIGFDMRMAGFTGCGTTPSSINILNNSTDWNKNILAAPLIGYERGVSTIPSTMSATIDSLSDSTVGDMVTILRGEAAEYTVNAHAPPSITLTGTHDFAQGEIMIATDCQHTVVFQKTGASTTDVEHGAGGGTPGNASADLGQPLGTAYTFAPGAKVLRMSAVSYQIRTNDNNTLALYRVRLAPAGLVADELAEGIEDMQITYGEDTNSDKQVDQYVTADAVTNWGQVLSLRISLLMASAGSDNVTTEAQQYIFNGATVTPTDRRLRKVFDTTIAVRNRL